MRIPVGYRAAATAKVRETFACPRCKHFQRAEVTTVGMGVSSMLWGRDLARERARANAGKSENAARVLRFATCPKCGKRSGHAAYIGRQLLMLLVVSASVLACCFVAPVIEHMDEDERAFCHTWLAVILIGFVVLVGGFTGIRDWLRTDRRVRWLDFERKAASG